jgi:hypothetical protein
MRSASELYHGRDLGYFISLSCFESFLNFALKIFVVITASVKLFFVVPVLFQVKSEQFPTLSLNSPCILRIRFV